MQSKRFGFARALCFAGQALGLFACQELGPALGLHVLDLCSARQELGHELLVEQFQYLRAIQSTLV